MKKILISLLFVLISLNVAFASDFRIQNGMKYISVSKAEEIWGVDIDYFSGSSLIRIKSENDVYYTKCYSNAVAKNIYINPFFMNSDKLIINGDIMLYIRLTEKYIYL